MALEIRLIESEARSMQVDEIITETCLKKKILLKQNQNPMSYLNYI